MLADGTLSTIEDDNDIYISLTQLCDYFTSAALTMQKEVEAADVRAKKYVLGMSDLMFTIAQEVVSLGKFEAQRRMIESPEDLFRMIDKKKFNGIE